MREIKFRALCDFEIAGDLQPRKMVYFGAVVFDDGIKAWPMPCDMDKIRSHESPLMQYTGLKDRNGIEVYEDDIVSIYSNRGVTEEHRSRVFVQVTGIMVMSNYAHMGLRPYKQLHAYEQFEVIGNIYENPELLAP